MLVYAAIHYVDVNNVHGSMMGAHGCERGLQRQGVNLSSDG